MNLGGLEPHWWWLAAALVLAAAELLLPGVFLIWLAAAAALTGVVTLILGIPLAPQFIVFALLTIAAVYFGRRWYVSHPVASSDPQLNDRTGRLIGETVVVVSAIRNGAGRVKVGDSVWNCRGPDAEVGARVRIAGSDGTCLLVEPAIIPQSPAIG